MTILVTGANGMIGSQLVKELLNAGYKVIGVDRNGIEISGENYRQYKVDLADKTQLKAIAESNMADRFIHLAALAHTVGENNLSWEQYKHMNVDCAKNLFEVAGNKPLLFISTVDVFGFYDGKNSVNSSTPIRPVSNYGKSKAMAEEECKKMSHYTIFRFSPVYTDEIKRDIQKRYYLKYPNIAYQIGKGTEYEILNVRKAVRCMVDWCREEPENDIKIIKDDKPLWTPDYIKAEKCKGHAKIVLRFPQWMVTVGYAVLKKIFGENEKTYLLNKAAYPLRTE